VSCSEPYTRRAFGNRIWLTAAGEDIPEERINGEWMGIMRVSAAALPEFRAQVHKLAANPINRKAKLHHLLNAIVAGGGEVRVIYTTGHWLDIDSVEDVIAAGNFG
jgi:phosphoenolpyruvate phosphomutase